MGFTVGETVVYPHHGAALIEAIEQRTIKGVEKAYLVLKVAQGDLTVRVPADNAEIVGVRDVVGQEGLDKVFEVLRAPHTEEPTNWSRRYKANLEKLASGDVNKVAEVVRDLWRRDKDRGLSAGEKRMLSKARQILVSELALAEGTNEDKAEVLLDEVLATRAPARLPFHPETPRPLPCTRSRSSQRPGVVCVWGLISRRRWSRSPVVLSSAGPWRRCSTAAWTRSSSPFRPRTATNSRRCCRTGSAWSRVATPVPPRSGPRSLRSPLMRTPSSCTTP